jgi:hypothetical protein
LCASNLFSGRLCTIVTCNALIQTLSLIKHPLLKKEEAPNILSHINRSRTGTYIRERGGVLENPIRVSPPSLAMPPAPLASVGLGTLEVRRTTTSRQWEVSHLSFRYLHGFLQDGVAAATS